MFNRIAIINKSTVVSNANANIMAAVCNLQLSRDVAPAWGRTSVPVAFYATESSVPAGAAKLYIFDTTTQMGTLGYHTETFSGQVFATVFAKTITNYGLPILYNPSNKSSVTVSSVVSHEVIEMFCNPYVDLWADGPTISAGSQYAYEACDAVEANMYQITVFVAPSNATASVSNFLYPEYFDTATPRGVKKDYLNLITAPFTMTPSGYMIVRDNAGNETALYGEKYPQVLKDLNADSISAGKL